MNNEGDEGAPPPPTKTATTSTNVKIILALDIGSSSIRCSPYECSYSSTSISASASTSESKSTSASTSTSNASETTVKVIQGCCSVRKVSSVQPNTGKIILTHHSHSNNITSSTFLFDEIDNCIDESLDLLRSYYNNNDTSNNNNNINNNNGNKCFQIIGIGISSFVMNLIGINSNGQIITNDENKSTLSYACNDPEVVKECHNLKQELGEEKLNELYQRTGAPLHNAYALGQLRVYYNQHNNDNNKTDTSACTSGMVVQKKKDVDIVHQWTTIASYCIQRWTGNGNNGDTGNGSSKNNSRWKNTISFSEASWTGLFNFHTCQWDDMCCDLLPTKCRESLPNVADLTDEYYFIEEYVSITQWNDDNGTTSSSTGRRRRNTYWDRWPELRGGGGNKNLDDKNNCRIFLGIGDGICANIGSKCSTSERIACTIGTSAAARVCLPYTIINTNNEDCVNNNNNDKGSKESKYNNDFVVPFGLFSYRIDKDHILLGGALTDGGSIVEFLRNLFNLENDEAFSSCLQDAALTYTNARTCTVTKCDEGRNGGNQQQQQLSVIPFLSGERSTGFRGGATGCITGLTRETKASDVLQSCLESVVLRLNHILKLIESICPKSAKTAKCIVASGNALERNLLWRQMLSDCTGKKVVKDGDAHEGTSRGVAILISRIIFCKNNPCTMSQEKLVIENEQSPHPLSQSFWSKQKESQDNAIQCISPLWK